jgi:two-component response regulator (ARR-A family)
MTICYSEFHFRCLEEGAEDFLLKPVRPSDISRITTRILLH